jgi:hypothetical protein
MHVDYYNIWLSGSAKVDSTPILSNIITSPVLILKYNTATEADLL